MSRSDPVDGLREQWVRNGWTASASGMSTVVSLCRVQRILQARVDIALRPFDMSFARFEILTLLSFAPTGAVPITKIGDQLQVHPTSISSAVNRLESSAFVQRIAHRSDRRIVLASITTAGRVMVKDATAAINSDVFEQLGLESDDVHRLLAVLRSLRANAGDF